MKALQEAGFSLKLKKCDFLKNKVYYLGHVVRPGKLAVAQKTNKAVEEFRLPETQTHIKSFLGLCNGYRRFVPNFARIAAPLKALLKKGMSPMLDSLSPKAVESFIRLKGALTEASILALPLSGLPYSLDTDACDYQVGFALMQL